MIEIEKLSPLLELLQRARVAHIKMDDLELSFQDPPAPPPVAPEMPALASSPIEHKDDPLTSAMKLSNEDLVDALFPLPKDSGANPS